MTTTSRAVCLNRIGMSRIAKKNPDIVGRKLYFSTIGLWTLDPNNAKLFDRADALELMRDDLETLMEPAP